MARSYLSHIKLQSNRRPDGAAFWPFCRENVWTDSLNLFRKAEIIEERRSRKEDEEGMAGELRRISRYAHEELAPCRCCMHVDLSGPMAVALPGHLQRSLAADEGGKGSLHKGLHGCTLTVFHGVR